ncbi:hypothetical protein [Archangium sp.]|uniref:hypothetical protein n=1 Tax=Archangium sp. TaxID=1872627 RepID=UPI00286C031C|nr:hypothetical protein [Archangium sp.]
MFDQTGQQPFPESENGSLGMLWTRQERSEGKALKDEGRPSFVSSAPPRSEGEALLHRIFSRGAAL